MDIRLLFLSLRNIGIFRTESLSVGMDLSRQVTVVIGENGTGKSTVLNALACGILAKGDGESVARLLCTFRHKGESGVDVFFGGDSDKYSRSLSIIPPALKVGCGGYRIGGDGTTVDLLLYAVQNMSAVNRLSKKVVYMGGKVPDHVNTLVHSFLARPESTKRIFQIVSLILYGKADSLYPLGTLDLGGNVHEMIVRTPESPDGVYVAQLGAGVFRVLMLVSVLVHSLLERFKDSPEFCDKTYTGAKGVVLIDEIDTHLSIHAQRRVLQELVHFFPQVQFVVSTNSLAVASSLQDKEQFLVYRTCYREDGLGWGLSECAPGENYSPVGSDLNSVADYLFKAPVRDTLYQDKLDLLCTMVANKQLEEAKGLIEWLKERIHPTDSELRRLEARYEAKMCIARAKAEKKES